MITLQNFSANNRDRKIGNSLYRICRENDDKGKWYIHEIYHDAREWVGNNAHYSNELKEVIEQLKSFTKEKEVVSLRF